MIVVGLMIDEAELGVTVTDCARSGNQMLK
jgi:hypothetical protein